MLSPFKHLGDSWIEREVWFAWSQIKVDSAPSQGYLGAPMKSFAADLSGVACTLNSSGYPARTVHSLARGHRAAIYQR